MRSVCGLALACVTAVALAAPATARAQTTDPIDRLVGRPITAIHLDVEGRRNDAPDLLELIEVQRNQPLDLATLRASVMQLHSAGRFDDIRVRGVESQAGVELIFELVPRHPVDRVVFEGVQGVPVGDLDRDLRQRFNGVPRGAQADAVARAVERTLAERGYRQATVRPSLETTHVPDRATLKLTVEMGPLTVVTSAKVEGASPLSAAEVLKRAGVVVGQPYRSRDIDLGLDSIIEDLRARGYYEAAVSHAGDVITADGRSATVVITVESAVPVTLKFEGDPLPGKEADLVPIKREGSADDDLLEDSVRRIESALRRDGYWKGRAAFTQASSAKSKVITFTVTRGPRYRFDRLEVSGSTQMTNAAIAALIGLEPDAPFDESKVARGVAALREVYRQQGFAAATITATPEALPPARANGDPRVVERLVIDEGIETRVADITVVGAMHLSPADVLAAMRLKKDGPYVPAFVPADREAVRLKFDERGYNAAVVDVRPTLSDDKSRATIRVDILSEGPQTLLDHVIIAGNRRVSDETIRAAVKLTTGQPLSTAARQGLQQRLSAMGLFRRVVITEAPHASGETGTDLIITVEESPTTTIAYGGGLEAGLRARTAADGGTVDKFELAPRASFEVGRTNINGKNRSANLFSGVSLRPIDKPGDPTRDGKCCGFSEYRVNGVLREQRLFGWNADGLVSLTVEQAIRSSFTFVKSDGSVQMLRRLSEHTTTIGRYSLERVRLDNVRIAPKDQLPVDRLFPQIRLSVLSSTIQRDTRSDFVSPASGALLSADTELAMRAIGSQVGFAKVFAQGFVYHRLDAMPRVVLAGGARIGLVRGFVRDVPVVDENGNQVYSNGLPVTARVEDVPASQRFFTGGSTSVRGFQQDRLGTPAILDDNGLSNGGNGMMVFNAEVRTALTKDLGIATFLDSGNVYSRVSAMRFSELRSALGAGIRYRSPIGPLRFDIGWKVGALRATDNRRWEFHFSIGEAF